MEQEIQRRPPHRELQLLPSFASQIPSSWPAASDHKQHVHPPASLDLQLSISLTRPVPGPAETSPSAKGNKSADQGGKVLKWEAAAEQIRLAAMEKAYAERVRELARKEMELAQNDLARASHVWERAREEVRRAERLKAARSVVAEESGGTCMEITCHCCRQRFLRRPS